jgi:hypothetical protein
VLRTLLRDAFRGDKRCGEPPNVARTALLRAGIAPGTPARDLTAAQWHRLALLLAAPAPD